MATDANLILLWLHMKIVSPSIVSGTRTQTSYQYTQRNAQTKSIVSLVMWFWALGDRLCWDGDWQHLKNGSEASLTAMVYGYEASKLRKWLYLIRKYTPLASSPPGGIIIILAGWPWEKQQAAFRYISNAHEMKWWCAEDMLIVQLLDFFILLLHSFLIILMPSFSITPLCLLSQISIVY